VEVGGASYPAVFNGKPVTPLEGKSLTGAFAGKAIERDALFWEHEGNAAVRAGDWKLVRQKRGGAWELYDMKADRTELHDLAAAQPDKAKALAAQWEAWAARAHVTPYPEAKPGKTSKKAKKNRRQNAPATP
jgi:arylsulfatase